MNLPEDFCSMMREQLGSGDAEKLFAALEEKAPVSVRLNRSKPSDVFAGEAESVAWCEDGRYLSQRPQFTLDPCLHAGCYYVQEASSMAVAQAFRAIPESPRHVLDLCAAPGGKSTLWASLLPVGSLLVCNEPVRSRANILAENVAKWGTPDAIVTNAYPADFAPLVNFFDVVAADVPCSGEGMFRKDDGARVEWSAANVRMCAERQFNIVRDVWPALRPGGFLVYSTCTFNHYEDEDNVWRICEELGADPVEMPGLGDVAGSIESTSAGVHFYPHLVRGEGFFIALLQKVIRDDVPLSVPSSPKAKKQKGKGSVDNHAAQSGNLSKWLRKPGNYRLLPLAGDGVCAVRSELCEDFQRILTTPVGKKVVSAGIPLATPKGRKWQPRPELALSTELSAEAFPRAELDYDQAIAYLRHEAITLPADAQRGYVVVCYCGHPLGFVNNLGTRANNLYPSEWRIRKIM